MSSLILKMLSNYFKKHPEISELEMQTKMSSNFNLIKETFTKLVNNGYLDKLPALDTEEHLNKKNKTPKFINLTDANKYDLPDLKIDGKQILLFFILMLLLQHLIAISFNYYSKSYEYYYIII